MRGAQKTFVDSALLIDIYRIDIAPLFRLSPSQMSAGTSNLTFAISYFITALGFFRHDSTPL